MTEKTPRRPRRDDALSRERIIAASIELLDSGGEAALTFRTLSERLATGPGAIYGHIASKHDLLVAACDAIVSRTVDLGAAGAAPAQTVRGVALAMFDAMDAHPWIGAALTWTAGQLTMVRIIECLGQQVRALGVAPEKHWATISALLNYILGVGGQNAANAQAARLRGAGRAEVLGAVAASWSQLDAQAYPFVRSVAAQMSAHDDRADFLVGIDLILEGMVSRAGH
ncbi:helix-turn-helix domain-containing protein [Janthinobacterium sp. J1-1]|uniref:TetR/AcrR family transcriptional regulator n=1 Tax=Janthinobacterium sp. J1-1 TaxID=3065910 RepID=UPI0028116D09|nr:helix-turn-helix domain-containing protein [Janthinobacterium sp. J1-1]